MSILVAWIGLTDVRASEGSIEAGLGPIGQAVTVRQFEKILLLSNLDKNQTAHYRDWLTQKTPIPVEIRSAKLSGPTEFGEIYSRVIEALSVLTKKFPNKHLTFHLSPGTPAMAAVWIIVSKTRFPAELIESSREAGVRTASVPFELSAEFIPNLIRQADEQFDKVSAELSATADRFSDIIFNSQIMRETVEQAKTIALHNVPVLIEGESGTGKELFAKAIHLESPRQKRSFIPVNCGAIPADLIESELFGHVKGAFTGADKNREGYFKEASGGTIFLDEIGELPLKAQVRLLRVLQEKEVTRVGTNTPEKIDVRVISATNRNLLEEVAAGRFREDLFYRLAVFPLYLPPLRERSGDLTLLINYFLKRLNSENTGKFWKTDKTFSAGAQNILLNHPWPGNIRELQNTILRACVLAKEAVITEPEIRRNLFIAKGKTFQDILNRPIGANFSLPNVLAEVANHYLFRALGEANQNKTTAAKLVGLKNYQTFDNWLNKYKLE